MNQQEQGDPEVAKGDRVQFRWGTGYATGVVMRVEKDGTRSIRPDSMDVNERCYVDRMVCWKAR